MTYKNLVFEGGGSKGVAFCGALMALDEAGILTNIKRVAGTSAGAINACLLSLGYSAEEIWDIMLKKDLSEFKDKTNYLKMPKDLISWFGIHSGDAFEIWLKDRIEEKLGKRCATFEDLKEASDIDLYVLGTNLSTGYTESFSYETTPKMHIHKAVRISMSIPLFFHAVFHDDCVWGDSGIQMNFPIVLFDDIKFVTDPTAVTYYQKDVAFNNETLGLKLDSKYTIDVLKNGQRPEPSPIDNFVEYVEALISALANQSDNYYLHTNNSLRTVFIDTLGYQTTQFSLTKKDKKNLFDSGYQATRDFLDM